MFKRILVPLDGSERAERALPVAARIARASGGSLLLLRVVNTALEFWSSAVSEAIPMQSMIDTHLAEAQQYLTDVATSVELDGISKEQVVLAGSTGPTMLSVAHSYHADLIVLCSHGYTGVTRRVLGSVAERVVRSAPVPVLVLRERGPLPVGPHPDTPHPLRALVALDGSTLAKAALEPAASLIAALAAPAQDACSLPDSRFKGSMHLVRVVQDTSSDEGEEDEQLLKAKKDLSSTAEHLREGLVAPAVAEFKLPVSWSVVVATDVAGAIVRVHDTENGEDAEGGGVFGECDVIAMATHGRGGIERWALGSITERVLNATRQPLLIVRPPDLMDKSNVTWDEIALSDIQG